MSQEESSDSNASISPAVVACEEQIGEHWNAARSVLRVVIAVGTVVMTILLMFGGGAAGMERDVRTPAA